jgi:hypothetical protein
MIKRLELMLSFVFPLFVSSLLFWAGVPASHFLRYCSVVTGGLCVVAIVCLPVLKLFGKPHVPPGE